MKAGSHAEATDILITPYRVVGTDTIVYHGSGHRTNSRHFKF